MRRHRHRRGPSTAVRLAGVHALLLLALLGLVAVALLRTFAAQTTAATSRTLVAEMHAFEHAAAARPTSEPLTTFARRYLRTVALPDGQFVVIGTPLTGSVGSAGSADLLGASAVRELVERPPTRGLQRTVTVNGRDYLLVAAPMTSSGGAAGTIVVAADVARTTSDFSRVRALVIGEALVALLAAVAAAYLLLRRLLRRIGRITATASDIGHGDLDRRLGDQGTDDEVGRLAATFDEMADRIADTVSVQRRLLSDVSHQLRTPLTVARGHLEVLERTGSDDPREVRETVDLVIDEIDHMKALVERLLLLGRALEPDFLEEAPVDLRTFCADLVEASRVLAVRNWCLSTVPDVVVRVDEAKLRGALLNLIDNAVKATADGDTIALLALRRPGGAIELSVDDNGPGIPFERRLEVLQRFARPGAADSDGSGLGLAIVTTVADAHGGRIAIGDSALGGCRVSLVLPAERVTESTSVPTPEPVTT